MVDRRPVHDRAILDAVEAIDPERFAGEVWRVTRAWTVPAPCISYYAIISSRAVAKRGRGHSMPDVNLPLSGPVTQTFPWTNYITINVGTSSNPAIEKDALSDVASYGKQLGRIGDALIVLFRHLPDEDKLPDDEKKAIADLKSMLHEIANVKERHGATSVLRP